MRQPGRQWHKQAVLPGTGCSHPGMMIQQPADLAGGIMAIRVQAGNGLDTLHLVGMSGKPAGVTAVHPADYRCQRLPMLCVAGEKAGALHNQRGPANLADAQLPGLCRDIGQHPVQ